MDAVKARGDLDVYKCKRNKTSYKIDFQKIYDINFEKARNLATEKLFMQND